MGWAARIGLGVLLLLAASALPVLMARWIPVPVTSFMVRDRLEAWSSDEAGYRFRHDWVAWESMSPEAALAVVAAEDQRFAEHHGFDLESIRQAMEAAEGGSRLRGASTITQQLAKNLFLWPGRSWVRKALEAWYTVLLEALWSKQRILEVYLNSVEFGRGVWGIEAASQHFFKKPAARLTRQDAALLAAALPNPLTLRGDRPGPWRRQRQAGVVSQVGALGGRAHLRVIEEAA
ncbi:MAG: monofunctional biosynthetic peptidoglycan transglycosylase [Steroidobacteraceae bacterium]